ncbi:hypothetical protein VCUG_00313 [Vavraia culicis subsp. floridensis]|uniref:Uncharacterized protein n=1 Tax=Vavraia culicis (isolate floridensis) TaxID=948595 RepID=L2GY40_VAVCU|nr:uncharacterized protein VCUG_00313 [Vavraia culicis subsp. floridensis]ELA48272.1 hypothetical protein VCUG_00313 [Vavraia culicis subsp. floridensis]
MKACYSHRRYRPDRIIRYQFGNTNTTSIDSAERSVTQRRSAPFYTELSYVSCLLLIPCASKTDYCAVVAKIDERFAKNNMMLITQCISFVELNKHGNSAR